MTKTSSSTAIYQRWKRLSQNYKVTQLWLTFQIFLRLTRLKSIYRRPKCQCLVLRFVSKVHLMINDFSPFTSLILIKILTIITLYLSLNLSDLEDLSKLIHFFLSFYNFFFFFNYPLNLLIKVCCNNKNLFHD